MCSDHTQLLVPVKLFFRIVSYLLHKPFPPSSVASTLIISLRQCLVHSVWCCDLVTVVGVVLCALMSVVVGEVVPHLSRRLDTPTQNVVRQTKP